MTLEDEKDCSGRKTWINRFYIDYDKVSLSIINKDMKLLFSTYPNCIVELYASGTPRHKTAVVRNIDITFRDALAFITISQCSRDYVKLIAVKDAFFMRISPKYVSYTDKPGMIVVPEPKIIRIYRCEGGKVIAENQKRGY